jgi:hypothetical protein
MTDGNLYISLAEGRLLFSQGIAMALSLLLSAELTKQAERFI